MTWQEALKIVVGRTGVERYRHLCSESNQLKPPNDFVAYRGLMLQLAGRPMTPTPDQWASIIGELRSAADDAPPHLRQPVRTCGSC